MLCYSIECVDNGNCYPNDGDVHSICHMKTSSSSPPCNVKLSSEEERSKEPSARTSYALIKVNASAHSSAREAVFNVKEYF